MNDNDTSKPSRLRHRECLLCLKARPVVTTFGYAFVTHAAYIRLAIVRPVTAASGGKLCSIIDRVDYASSLVFYLSLTLLTTS